MFPTSGYYNNRAASTLPTQMIPKSEKTDDWKKACMDALEVEARGQFQENVKLIENYEMVKGKFIFKHYLEQDDFTDLISQLTKEFELPSYLRHYDIISQVINTLSGEWQSRPDVFRVKGKGEEVTNEFVRTKTDLLTKYIVSKVNAEINQRLLQEGIDPDKQDFSSQEEQQQYQQALDEARKQLTPPQIEEYMASDWFTAAEVWGQEELEDSKKKYRLEEREKKEFEDMLIADRCFRHFYITPSGYNQETWNPVNVFFHQSPEVDYVEDGDYAGRIVYLTIPDIIDRYGFRMTKSQIELLREQEYNINGKWNSAGLGNYTYKQYTVPWKDYPDYKLLNDAGVKRGFTETYLSPNAGIPMMDSRSLNALNNVNYGPGYHCVVEGYWKSQKKIGKVTYIDEETGLETVDLVDEDFIIPKSFTVIDGIFEDSQDVNTVVWTYVNETLGGELK